MGVELGNKVKLLKSGRFGFKRFRKDEEGALTAFAVVMFLMMIVGAGMATDFMRHETYRAELQNALDRGVLAAAAFSQDITAKTTVEEYVFSSVNHTAGTPTVVVQTPIPDNNLISRKVTATAEYEFSTSFLRIIGIPTMKVIAKGTAEQKRQNVEISMVLDISPSMDDNGKLAAMKQAASTFVDTVLAGDFAEYTSVTVVPYGGHASAGPTLFKHYATTQLHSYSYCLDFAQSEFTTLAMSPTTIRGHMPHFNYGAIHLYPAGTGWGWCPTAGSEIIPFSNTPGPLKTAINGLGMHEATGIQNGLKWGLGLLDPTSAPVVTKLIDDDKIVSGDFRGRPGAYTDANTVKFVVLMTDGAITLQKRLESDKYDTQEEIDYYGISGVDTDDDGVITSADDNHNAGNADTDTFVTEATARANLMSLCNKARETVTIDGETRVKTRIFTIGFELPALDPDFDPLTDTATDPAEVMVACASTPADAYLVDGVNIGSAFEQIAKTIKNLKLTE